MNHHRFHSNEPDSPDNTKLNPGDWNDEHVYDGGALGSLLFRDTNAPDGASWLPSTTGFLASPGTDQTPIYRALVAGDIPALPYAPLDLTGFVTNGDIVSLAWTKLTGVPAFGNSALLNVGTGSNNVAAGNHLHTGVYEPVISTLGATRGGTGLSSFAIGDLFYADSSSSIAKLASVATGSVLVPGGVGVAPAWSNTPSLTKITFMSSNGSRLWELSSTLTGESINFGAVYNKNHFTNGGAGSNEAYDDDVYSWGWNISNTVGSPLVAGKAQPSYTIENKFYTPAGRYGSEFHLSLVDTSGINHRAQGFFLPHDGGLGSSVTVAIDQINWTDWQSTAAVQWNLLTKVADFSNSFVLRFDVNNTPALKQLNAAGNAYLNLPYYTNENRLATASPFSIVAGAPPTTGSYANIFGVVQCSSLPSGGSVFDVYGPGVTGSYTLMNMQGNASGNLQVIINNQNSANAAAHSFLTVSTSATGGDPYVAFNAGGGILWRCGIDNSDSGKLKFAFAANLGGAADRFVLTQAGALTIAAGITHGSATLLTTSVALTNGAAAQTGSLTNAPAAGNPTKWIPINDNGTTRYIPAW